MNGNGREEGKYLAIVDEGGNVGRPEDGNEGNSMKEDEEGKNEHHVAFKAIEGDIGANYQQVEDAKRDDIGPGKRSAHRERLYVLDELARSDQTCPATRSAQKRSILPSLYIFIQPFVKILLENDAESTYMFV